MLFYPAALPLSSRTLNYTAGIIRRYRTGDTVLVCETVEDLLSADPVLSDVDLRWPGVSLSGCELAEGTVQPQPRWPGRPPSWGNMRRVLLGSDDRLVAVGVMNVGHGGAGGGHLR